MLRRDAQRLERFQVSKVSSKQPIETVNLGMEYMAKKSHALQSDNPDDAAKNRGYSGVTCSAV